MSVKIRKFPEYNYFSIFDSISGYKNRFEKPGEDNKELPPESSEFYDIAITSRCHGGCSWCYAKATPKGENYIGICETWKTWMNEMDKNSRPFSVAIGSIGEPTEHPEFTEFLKTVYESDVSPSYTTNGIILGTPGDPRAREILDATEKYCKGVSLSLGNKKLQRYQQQSLRALSETGVKIALHHIISDVNSVKEFIKIWKSDKNRDYTHVLLPMVDSFCKSCVSEEVWITLKSKILNYEMDNIAFGSKFTEKLEEEKFVVSLYPDGLYSKNIILKNKTVIITKNSFDLRPIKIIKL